MRDNDITVQAGSDIMDMASPVQGPGGVMYPLTHHRAEDVDIDFVLDVDETELVVAPDVTLLSGAKGGLLWLVGMIVLVDIVILAGLPEMLADWKDMVASTIVTLLFLVLSVAFCLGMVRSVRRGNRVEPVLFNRVARTVTHFGSQGVRTYPWERLRPFVRIVRVVNTVGGGQTYQLVLADVDPSTGRVGTEFVAGKGDLIGAGVLRYGFFKTYMDQPLERLPSFRLVSASPDWMQRLALSIWTFPGLAQRWLGERPWSPLVGLGSVLNTALAMPLQMPELLAARISLGPYGEGALAPWLKRFNALPAGTTLRRLARTHAAVVAPARRCIPVALAIGTAFWVGVLWLLGDAVLG